MYFSYEPGCDGIRPGCRADVSAWVSDVTDQVGLALWLNWFEGFERSEVGEIMDIPVMAVDRLLAVAGLPATGLMVARRLTSNKMPAPASLLTRLDSLAKGIIQEDVTGGLSAPDISDRAFPVSVTGGRRWR